MPSPFLYMRRRNLLGALFGAPAVAGAIPTMPWTNYGPVDVAHYLNDEDFGSHVYLDGKYVPLVTQAVIEVGKRGSGSGYVIHHAHYAKDTPIADEQGGIISVTRYGNVRIVRPSEQAGDYVNPDFDTMAFAWKS